ncbi:MAG: tetratricopeptide repeat protein [Armatimonadetes bacterium]|nr:tetratricopeptide repeat protein [Armatimonadota bacterium]
MNASDRPDPMVEDAIHKLLASAKLFRIRGQFDAAEEKCKEALALAPQNTEALEMMGDIAYDRGSLEEALHLYKTAVEIRSTPSLETKYAKVALEIGEQARQREMAETLLNQPEQAVQRKRSQAVAFILSTLVPGMGQLYNGDMVKGLIIMAIMGLCAVWLLSSPYFADWFRSILSLAVTGTIPRDVTASAMGMGWLPATIFTCGWLYSVIDALRGSVPRRPKTGFEV